MPDRPAAPATQHRVIPVEWHRVAVEPGDNAPARVEPQEKVTWDPTKVFQCRCGVTAMPLTDDTVCKCKGVYEQEWNLVDVCQCKEPSFTTPRGNCFNCQRAARPSTKAVGPACGCRSGLSWPCPTCYKASLPVSAAQPATDDQTADTIPLDLKRDYEDARGGGHFSYGNYHVARIIERTGRAETRIEVLEAALRESREILEEMRTGAKHHPTLCSPSGDYKCPLCKRIAALAAPSGEEKP